MFPKLALGLSGFETGVSVMPLIDGGEQETAITRERRVPQGRIANTRKLLAHGRRDHERDADRVEHRDDAADPGRGLSGGRQGRRARDRVPRARISRHVFGTVYDLSTIVILGFAGASAMAGLLDLIPRYLPRYGMAPRWAAFSRPLVLVLFGVDVVVTLMFSADVEAQGGAYATGVLRADPLCRLRRHARVVARAAVPLAFYSGLLTLVFAYTLVDNCIERPDGLIIGTVFTLLLMLACGISRSMRSIEFRIP